MTELQKHVNALVEKAANAIDPTDALKFSQAALNVANTYHALRDPHPQ